MPDLSIDDRPAFVFQPRDGELTWDLSDGPLAKLAEYDRAWELVLVNRIRQRVAEWRRAGYPNASATTLDMLSHWRPLFVARGASRGVSMRTAPRLNG